jgi:hypothetical protein
VQTSVVLVDVFKNFKKAIPNTCGDLLDSHRTTSVLSETPNAGRNTKGKSHPNMSKRGYWILGFLVTTVRTEVLGGQKSRLPYYNDIIN